MLDLLTDPWVIVFLLGLAPFSESRGAILYGKLVGLDSINLFFVAVAANLVVIPFIWLIVNSRLMGTITHFFGGGVQRLVYDNQEKFYQHHAMAVLLFIITPVFGGVWTGVLLANVIGMKPSHALVLISLGAVLAASLVFFGVDVVGSFLATFFQSLK